MYRYHFLLIVFVFFILPDFVNADTFDEYTNIVLKKMVENDFCREIDSLTLKEISDLDPVLLGIQAGFIIVRTNEGRYSRALVQFARQKIDANNATPMILLERFTTYREGEEHPGARRPGGQQGRIDRRWSGRPAGHPAPAGHRHGASV